jgi:hypothetical protein
MNWQKCRLPLASPSRTLCAEVGMPSSMSPSGAGLQVCPRSSRPVFALVRLVLCWEALGCQDVKLPPTRRTTRDYSIGTDNLGRSALAMCLSRGDKSTAMLTAHKSSDEQLWVCIRRIMRRNEMHHAWAICRAVGREQWSLPRAQEAIVGSSLFVISGALNTGN